jgi:hypothetical protein
MKMYVFQLWHRTHNAHYGMSAMQLRALARATTRPARSVTVVFALLAILSSSTHRGLKSDMPPWMGERRRM